MTQELLIGGITAYAWIGGVLFGFVAREIMGDPSKPEIPILAWIVLAMSTVIWPLEVLIVAIVTYLGERKMVSASRDAAKEAVKDSGLTEEQAEALLRGMEKGFHEGSRGLH